MHKDLGKDGFSLEGRQVFSPTQTIEQAGPTPIILQQHVDPVSSGRTTTTEHLAAFPFGRPSPDTGEFPAAQGMG